MQPPVQHIVSGNSLWLSAQRSIYWEEEQALILADLHLGKTGHFRKAGIGIPQSVYKEDLQRLLSLIQFFKPEKMIVVGDMFHSEANSELELFSRWRKDVDWLQILLVKGNHDILSSEWYSRNDIIVHNHCLEIASFSFRHEAPHTTQREKSFVFSGHIHPGVALKGQARQQLRFPCFHFTAAGCTLPAFSRFTGFVPIKKQPDHTVFAIVNDTLITV